MAYLRFSRLQRPIESITKWIPEPGGPGCSLYAVVSEPEGSGYPVGERGISSCGYGELVNGIGEEVSDLEHGQCIFVE